MLQHELQQYLLREYPQENARCERKGFKKLKNSFFDGEKVDVISYVSAIANMEGGHLVIGVKDKTLEIVGTEFQGLHSMDSLPICSRLRSNLQNNALICRQKGCP